MHVISGRGDALWRASASPVVDNNRASQQNTRRLVSEATHQQPGKEPATTRNTLNELMVHLVLLGRRDTGFVWYEMR